MPFRRIEPDVAGLDVDAKRPTGSLGAILGRICRRGTPTPARSCGWNNDGMVTARTDELSLGDEDQRSAQLTAGPCLLFCGFRSCFPHPMWEKDRETRSGVEGEALPEIGSSQNDERQPRPTYLPLLFVHLFAFCRDRAASSWLAPGRASNLSDRSARGRHLARHVPLDAVIPGRLWDVWPGSLGFAYGLGPAW
jgi:hypothetical protein